jgi:hypothetical protein
MGSGPDSQPETVPRKGGFLATLVAVLWSFFGVRRSDRHTEDMQHLNPVHVIVVGILAAAVFVLTLVGIVKAVVP